MWGMSSRTKGGPTTGRPPQRWARIACWTAFISALLPVVWRIAMLCGVDLGFSQADFFRSNASATAYVLRLETIQVLAGTLCLGLIRPWGERVPRWVPRLGRREIPRILPLVVGGIGNALLYYINATLAIRFGAIWLGLAQGWTPAEGMNRWQVAVLVAAYVPMLLLWAPALTVGLVGYGRRRAPH